MVDQVITKPITAAALMAFEAADQRYEVVNGQLIEVIMAEELHGAIATNLLLAIGNFVKKQQLGRVYPGDTTFVLDGEPDDIRLSRLPDISFVAKDRLKTADRKGFYYQAPDLAIEIISHSERVGEIEAKLQDYLTYGVRQVWQVYPETQKVIVYPLNGQPIIYTMGQTIGGGDVLPGFEITVAEIFE